MNKFMENKIWLKMRNIKKFSFRLCISQDYSKKPWSKKIKIGPRKKDK